MKTFTPRPIGITLLALLFLLIALLNLGLAAFILVNPDDMMSYILLFERLQLSAALINLLAAPPLFTAGLAGLVFRGLWNMESWARPAVLTLLFLLTLVGVAGLAFLAAFELTTPLSLMIIAGFLLLCAVLFVYVWSAPFESRPSLSTPEVELGAPSARLSSSSQSALEVAYRPSDPVAAPPAAFVPPPPRARPPDISRPEPPTVAAEPTPDAATRRLEPISDAATQRLTPATAALTSVQQPLAWLVVENGADAGKRFPLYADETLIIGRDPARAQAVLTDPTVSGRHAQVEVTEGRFLVRDLNSTNGVYVRDLAVTERALQDGDEVRLGACRLRFHLVG